MIFSVDRDLWQGEMRGPEWNSYRITGEKALAVILCGIDGKLNLYVGATRAMLS